MIVNVNKKALKFETIYNANIQPSQKTQLYSKILLQRPWWRLTKSEHNANLTISVSAIDQSIFAAKASPTCIFNQLPGMDLILNEQRLYDAFYATYKEKTYDSLKLSYKIPSEMTKLLNHLHYGDLQKTNEATSFIFDSGITGRFPEVQEQWVVDYEKKRKEAADERRASRRGQRAKFAPNITPPVNQDFEKFSKQENINDLIWNTQLPTTAQLSPKISTGYLTSQISSKTSPPNTWSGNRSTPNGLGVRMNVKETDNQHDMIKRLRSSSVNKSVGSLSVSQLQSGGLPSLSAVGSNVSKTKSGSIVPVQSPVASETRIETLPYAPRREVKRDAPPQSLPPQYAVVDPKINQGNAWEILKDGKPIEIVFSVANFVSYFGKSMRKVLKRHRWQVRKCCERRLIINEKPVLLRRHVLIRAGGDIFLFAEPLFELEEDAPDVAELEGASKHFTKYYDARLLPATSMDELVKEKFQVHNFFHHYLDAPTRKIIIQTIMSQCQQLQRQIQCPYSFSLLEYSFQIGGYTDGFPVRLERISSDIDMSPRSAATFVIFPCMIDDLFALTIDQVMSEHAEECRKLLAHSCTAVEYVREIDNGKQIPDSEQMLNGTETFQTALSGELDENLGVQAEITTGDLAVLVAKAPLSSRKLDFLRFSGNRKKTDFVQIIQKWTPLDL